MSNSHMQACIDASTKCIQVCFECFNQSLNEPSLNARKESLKLLIECTMMYQMSVAMMSMDSKFAAKHCQLCAEICEKCAQLYDQFNDQHPKHCAEVCRACATECRKIASA